MRNSYLEFNNEADADNWGQKYYADLYKSCRNETEIVGNGIIKSLYQYTGCSYLIVNNLLRNSPKIGSADFNFTTWGEFENEKEDIVLINDELYKYSTPENIVVYRYTHRKNLRKLCNNGKIITGTTFSDKAFLSTTLVKNSLSEYAVKNKYNCILKLYLPKGTPGVYISFEKKYSALKEYEFLLPPNMKFMIIKKQRFVNCPIIECQLIMN